MSSGDCEKPRAEAARKKKPKALALLSGGLDSILAVKLVMNQGVEVETVYFMIPFLAPNELAIDRIGEDLGVKVHKIFLEQEFLDMVANPSHGYGSRMNPCIDCRILMLKKARELAEDIGADFLVTGEVLDERPFSQRREALLLIEKEAEVEGRVLRPLSAKLLPESEPERRRIINRDSLLAIRGRRRLPQMELAEKLGITEYPTPSGGCLLTDPRFAERLREHLKHEGRLKLKDAELLRIGRHFRVNGVKVVVGRNEEENDKLLALAKRYGLPCLEVIGYKGPLALLDGKGDPESIKKAAAITARYSDAPKNSAVKVRYKDQQEEAVEVKPLKDEELETLRI